jgi:lambda family phage minor tail protein L
MALSTDRINKTILQAEPEAIVQLFEVDFSILDDSIGNLLFHPGEINKFQTGSILWNEERYIPLSCIVDGFELLGDGKLPRPKITVANYKGIISKYLKMFGEITGAKITRRRTFLKFLDAKNFPDDINPYGDSDFSAKFQDDIFFINNKTAENKHSVEFELVSILELEQVFLPSRQIMSSYCNWIYRSSVGCNYSGAAVADKRNIKMEDHASLKNVTIEPKANTWSSADTYKIGKQVSLEGKLGSRAPEGYDGATNEDKTKVPSYYVCIKENKNKNPRISPEHWVKDECSKNLEGCKCRFGEGVLPFGGFPGTEKFGFSG